MLHTVNGHPYISFDHLPIDFERLHAEVIDMFTFNSEGCFYSGPTVERDSASGQLYAGDVFNNLPVPEQQYLMTLDRHQRTIRMKVKHGVYAPWTVCPLNEMRDWDLREQPRSSWLPATYSVMPYFVEVMNRLDFFKPGWARIYGNEAYNYTPPHRDRDVVKPATVKHDQFLMMNLNRKPLYLIDDETGAKTYIDSKLVFFDVANLHATDPEPKFNYTIRIDGQFSQAMLSSFSFSRTSNY